MFNKGEIWAYPTDTSFGLGVRCDDLEGLQRLTELKGRGEGKYFSLMVKDWEMLEAYAEVPEGGIGPRFFKDQPRTAILKPSTRLVPTGFWPDKKVAFRVCTRPEIAKNIDVPITATSANLSGEPSIYKAAEIIQQWSGEVFQGDDVLVLPEVPASEIWDFTAEVPQRLR